MRRALLRQRERERDSFRREGWKKAAQAAPVFFNWEQGGEAALNPPGWRQVWRMSAAVAEPGGLRFWERGSRRA